jgi:hypothetical protein
VSRRWYVVNGRDGEVVAQAITRRQKDRLVRKLSRISEHPVRAYLLDASAIDRDRSRASSLLGVTVGIGIVRSEVK